MPNYKIRIILITGCIVCLGLVSFVKAGDSNNADFVEVQKQGIFAKIKSFLGRISVWIFEGVKKALTWCKDKIKDFWQWLKTRRGAIKQGIDEEKIEFSDSWANLKIFFEKIFNPLHKNSK